MRHRFHSLCPYFAMFPESFVQKHLAWAADSDELVLDPFSGRGTTVFESLLAGHDAIGGDTNPVAVCVSRAKADPPLLSSVKERITDLEQRFARASQVCPAPDDEFFRVCFSESTLEQILFLREWLNWKTSRVDRFIAAIAMGCLHGESHKSPWCFSNRMPRTISTKPEYSVRWWRERGCVPPKRDVFPILRHVAAYRYESPLPNRRGRVRMCDVRRLSIAYPDCENRVGLVVTSPPYLDTTNYREDQWLRLWFLGGPPKPAPEAATDDRHREPGSYWKFLTEAWAGIAPLLRDGAHIVVRLGGKRIDDATVGEELKSSLRTGLDAKVKEKDRRSSRILNSQVHAFRPGAIGVQVEHDFVFRVG